MNIHLQDCILSSTRTNHHQIDRQSEGHLCLRQYRFDRHQPDENTLDGNIGGATGVGVRLLDSGSNKVTLGTPIEVSFPTNAYQELNYKARMEPVAGSGLPGVTRSGPGEL